MGFGDMTISRIIFATVSAGLMAAAPAFADKVHLTAAEKATVTDACETGITLVPVQSDFGYETGDYALPISGRNGEVHSAMIISETALRDIPECRVNIEALADSERDERDNRVS